MRSFTLSLGSLSIGLALLSSPALAQDGDEVQCHLDRATHTILCDEIAIEGDAPRPFVLLTRTRDDYEPPPLERDLAREIPRTVRRAPF